MSSIYTKRFEELIGLANNIETTKSMREDALGNYLEEIDDNDLLRWNLKAKQLLINVCGTASHYTADFNAAAAGASMYTTSLMALQRARAIFEAAKDDHAAGMFVSLKTLVQAELFDNELDQAAELLSAGYIVPTSRCRHRT